MGISNNEIKRIKALQQKKFRDESGLFIVEGEKMVAELLESGWKVDHVYYRDEIGDDCMKRISALANPSPVLAVAHKPEDVYIDDSQELDTLVSEGGLFLALDTIRDPGNLGTILRTADALSIPVALLEGCADPYSHKVVRSSMGVVFRKCVVQTTWAEVRKSCAAAGIAVGVTALSDRAKDIRQAQVGQMAVVIGSEGQGVRSEILEQADHELIIPMNPNCESLNAAIAAAIVMWQMK